MESICVKSFDRNSRVAEPAKTVPLLGESITTAHVSGAGGPTLDSPSIYDALRGDAVIYKEVKKNHDEKDPAAHVKKAAELTTEWVTANADLGDTTVYLPKNVHVVWYNYTLGNVKIVTVVEDLKDLYFEITHNYSTNEWYVNVYKKIDGFTTKTY